MNTARLREAEAKFLSRYPGGFSDPLVQEITKKHKLDKMHQLALGSFDKGQFDNPSEIVDSMGKIVSQSSMVSIFEKPKFKDTVKTMGSGDIEKLSLGLKEFLHGEQQTGFEMMSSQLGKYKLAKWPLLTVCPVYYRPDFEVFVKPTTVKGVIEFFELEGLKYSPTPSYQFYRDYRDQINLMKKQVGFPMKNDNASFCGFLMMSLDGQQ